MNRLNDGDPVDRQPLYIYANSSSGVGWGGVGEPVPHAIYADENQPPHHHIIICPLRNCTWGWEKGGWVRSREGGNGDLNCSCSRSHGINPWNVQLLPVTLFPKDLGQGEEAQQEANSDIC